MRTPPSILRNMAASVILAVVTVFGGCRPYGKTALVADRGRCPEGLSENTGMAPPFCRPERSTKSGEPCSADENCLSGLICNFGYAHGHCEPERASADHEPCQDDRNCSPGLLCSGSSTPPFRPGQCHQPGSP